MPDFTGTVQEHPRSRRDTYLGTAAIAVSVYSALDFGRLVALNRHVGPLLSLGGAAIILILLGALIKAFGFAWAGAGFLGYGSARASRFRRAGYILAGGCGLVFLGDALAYLISPYYYGYPFGGWELALGVAVTAYHGLAAVAALLVARSFGRARRWHSRNAMLGWAAVVLGGGSALLLFWDIGSLKFGLSNIGLWEPVYQTHTLEAGWSVSWLVALAVAAVGFFSASRVSRSLPDNRPTRRAGFLMVAAVALVVASALGMAQFLIMLRYNWDSVAIPEARDLSRFAFCLLGVLENGALLVGSLLAFFGFAAERKLALPNEQVAPLAVESARK